MLARRLPEVVVVGIPAGRDPVDLVGPRGRGDREDDFVVRLFGTAEVLLTAEVTVAELGIDEFGVELADDDFAVESELERAEDEAGIVEETMEEAEAIEETTDEVELSEDGDEGSYFFPLRGANPTELVSRL